MDEKKPTTAKKGASSSAATKRTYTKKTAPAVEKPAPVVAAEPEELGVDPFITEEPVKKVAPKKDEKEYINVFIPLDPSLADIEGQYIMGSDNGRFFKYKRGESHRLEKGHAEYILSRINGAKKLEQFIEENRYKV